MDNLIEPVTVRSVEVSFGMQDGNPAYPSREVYLAYDPMIVHNNPQDVYDDPGRIARSLGGLLPAVGDTKGGVVSTGLGQVTVQGGSLVGIRINRADVATAEREYTGAVGITQVRWRLVTAG